MTTPGHVVPVAGRYFILEECIGRGGSARVHKVQCLKTGTTYAEVVDGKNSKRMKSFSREIDLLQRFSGEQDVVQLITHEVLHDRYVIAMILEHADCSFDREKKKNAHLRRVEKGIGSLSISMIVKFFKQMAMGVSAAHSRDIIHFDLKPENFLLFCDKVSGVRGVEYEERIKLADFGIAGEIDRGSTHVLRNRKVGTVTFMAPETVYQPHEGPLILRKSADVWSLGVILFRMVYKTTPFSHLRCNYTRLLIAISDPRVEVVFPDVRELRKQDPEQFWTLQRVMRGCLRQEQENRWTIEDILQMLDLDSQKASEEVFTIRHPQQAKELRKLVEESNRRPSTVQSSAVSETPGALSDGESCGSSYLSCSDPVIARLLAPQSREEASMMRRAAQSVQATSFRGSIMKGRVASSFFPPLGSSAGAASFNADLGESDEGSSDPTAETDVLAESELCRVAWHHWGQIPTPRSAAPTLIEATSRLSLRSRRPMASTSAEDTGNSSPTSSDPTLTRTVIDSNRCRKAISSSEGSLHTHTERGFWSTNQGKCVQRPWSLIAVIFLAVVVALAGALGATGAAGRLRVALNGPRHDGPAPALSPLQSKAEEKHDPGPVSAPVPAAPQPDDGTRPEKPDSALQKPTRCRLDYGQCSGVSFVGTVTPNTSISCDPGFSGLPVGVVCKEQGGRVTTCPVCTPIAAAPPLVVPSVNNAGAAAAIAAEEQRRAAQEQRRNREREERQRDDIQKHAHRSSDDAVPEDQEVDQRAQEVREEEARRLAREQNERGEAERKTGEETISRTDEKAQKKVDQEARFRTRKKAEERARRGAARKAAEERRRKVQEDAFRNGGGGKFRFEKTRKRNREEQVHEDADRKARETRGEKEPDPKAYEKHALNRVGRRAQEERAPREVKRRQDEDSALEETEKAKRLSKEVDVDKVANGQIEKIQDDAKKQKREGIEAAQNVDSAPEHQRKQAGIENVTKHQKHVMIGSQSRHGLSAFFFFKRDAEGERQQAAEALQKQVEERQADKDRIERAKQKIDKAKQKLHKDKEDIRKAKAQAEEEKRDFERRKREVEEDKAAVEKQAEDAARVRQEVDDERRSTNLDREEAKKRKQQAATDAQQQKAKAAKEAEDIMKTAADAQRKVEEDQRVITTRREELKIEKNKLKEAERRLQKTEREVEEKTRAVQQEVENMLKQAGADAEKTKRAAAEEGDNTKKAADAYAEQTRLSAQRQAEERRQKFEDLMKSKQRELDEEQREVTARRHELTAEEQKLKEAKEELGKRKEAEERRRAEEVKRAAAVEAEQDRLAGERDSLHAEKAELQRQREDAQHEKEKLEEEDRRLRKRKEADAEEATRIAQVAEEPTIERRAEEDFIAAGNEASPAQETGQEENIETSEDADVEEMLKQQTMVENQRGGEEDAELAEAAEDRKMELKAEKDHTATEKEATGAEESSPKESGEIQVVEAEKETLRQHTLAGNQQQVEDSAMGMDAEVKDCIAAEKEGVVEQETGLEARRKEAEEKRDPDFPLTQPTQAQDQGRTRTREERLILGRAKNALKLDDHALVERRWAAFFHDKLDAFAAFDEFRKGTVALAGTTRYIEAEARYIQAQLDQVAFLASTK